MSNIPKDIKGADRKLWTKLFADFNPRNQIEIEMGRRYLAWFQMFQRSKDVCEVEGTVVEAKNGVPYPSPHYSNMVKAEGEMRRLLKQLEASMGESKDEQEDVGNFKGL